MPSISRRKRLGEKEQFMRSILTVLVSLAVVFGAATAADAKSKKKRQVSHSQSHSYSPATVAERQRRASTFDETQYYEVDSRRLPFGSAAWWRQLQQENDAGTP
jgi:opacity protein-like surface antigen